MRLCYIDESGLHDESPVATMVGVIIDTQRLRPTLAEFASMFSEVEEQAGRSLDELRASHLYKKKGRFRDMEGPARAMVFERAVGWFAGRKHHLVLSAIDKERFEAAEAPDGAPSDIWPAMALHIVLQVQRHASGTKLHKGQTLLVFDENLRFEGQLSDQLAAPAEWMDAYYGYRGPGDRLDRIVDAPLFVDSKRVRPVQLADLFAFVYRRFIPNNASPTTGRSSPRRGWSRRCSTW
jgi:hypothetical protein